LGWTFAIFHADPTPVSITFRVSIIQFFPLYLNHLLTKPLLEVILVFQVASLSWLSILQVQ
jgi:hypothetical protein